MRFDECAGDGEADSGAGLVVGVGSFGAEIAFKNVFYVFRGDSFAVVYDFDDDGSHALTQDADVNFPTGGGVPQGVGEEVGHDLGEALAVNADEFGGVTACYFQGYAFFLVGTCGGSGGIVDETTDDDGAVDQVEAVFLGSRDIIKI